MEAPTEQVAAPANQTEMTRSVPERAEAEWAIRNPQQAIERTWAYFSGSEEQASASANAVLMDARSENAPFVWPIIESRSCWSVTLSNVCLNYSGKPKAGDEECIDGPSRVVNVLLDPGSGKLVKFSITNGEGSEFMELDHSAAESKLVGAGGERWIGLPQIPPISIVQALAAIKQRGFSAYSAKEIVGECVIKSAAFRPDENVWSVEMRADVPHGLGHGAPETRTSLRHLINADTGKWQKATTSPTRKYSSASPNQPEAPSPEEIEKLLLEKQHLEEKNNQQR